MANCKQPRDFICSKAFMATVLLLCGNILPVLTTVRTERVPELNALADVLGIPINEDVGPKRARMPEFLETVYNCWSSGSNECMPEETTGANVVRSFLGHETQSVPRAVQSYNQETELLNSLAITFNITYKMRQPEIIKYALLRIHRRALLNEEIENLKQKCDFSHLELRVYTTLGSNDKGDQVVVLKQTKDLNFTMEQLSESEWYSFYNFTEMYKTDVENPMANKQQTVMVRLSVSDSELCSGISPSLLGFTTSSGSEAELIGFTRNHIQDAPFTSRMINHLAAMYRRRKRQATAVMEGSGNVEKTGTRRMGSKTVDNTEVNFDNITNITTSQPEEQRTLDEMREERCQLYSHTISFVDLEWERYVLQPESYDANFCVGSCSWPLERHDNTTKHSYIQGVANFKNPEDIPPPCCVPKDLDPLLVSLQQAEGVYEVKRWDEMVARSCSCR